MRVKYTLFGVLVVFLVLAMNLGLQADIEDVRGKEVLDSQDLQVIDDFVARAIQDLVDTRDFTSIAKTRSVILAHKNSSKESAQAQYTGQFSESADRYISAALKQTSELKDKERRVKVILNLLILVDNLQDPRLADLALGMLNDENTVIRYWAVHCVTNPDMIRQLDLGEVADLELAVRIAEKLDGLLEQACSEITALAAGFAAEVRIQQGQDLLLKIADMRISQYADWTVDYEFLETVILKLLYDKISSAATGKSDMGRRFAQLYSYVMQRYIKDTNGGNFLSAARRHQSASVLVEIERACIGPLLGMPQLVIKRAVEQNDATALLLEHSRLFGDETRAGQLAQKLEFDYGTKPDGTKHTAPPALPERPSSKVGS